MPTSAVIICAHTDERRPQIVRVNLGGGAATVSNWSTQRFTYNCASVFDTYLRDVDISPDGSYFVTPADLDGRGEFTLGSDAP